MSPTKLNMNKETFAAKYVMPYVKIAIPLIMFTLFAYALTSLIDYEDRQYKPVYRVSSIGDEDTAVFAIGFSDSANVVEIILWCDSKGIESEEVEGVAIVCKCSPKLFTELFGVKLKLITDSSSEESVISTISIVSFWDMDGLIASKPIQSLFPVSVFGPFHPLPKELEALGVDFIETSKPTEEDFNGSR
jgi:hypothetical protein